MKLYLIAVPAVAFFLSCSPEPETATINERLADVMARSEMIMEMTEPEERPFGRLGHVAMGEDGSVFVSDTRRMQVYRFSADGKLVQTIGRQGQGPGEFEQPERMHLKGDTLWVHDRSRTMLQGFVPDEDGNRQVNKQITLEPGEFGFPVQVYASADGFIVAYARIIDDEEIQRSDITLGSINSRGDVIEPEVLTYTEREMVVESSSEFLVGHAVPFDWQTMALTDGAEKLIIAKTDSLRVQLYDIKGNKTGQVRNEIGHRKVTQQDIDDSWIERDSPAYREIPEFHPAFNQFRYGGESSYWFHVTHPTPDIENVWIELDDTGELIRAVELPTSFFPGIIRNNRMYGVYSDDESGQSVRIYEVN